MIARPGTLVDAAIQFLHDNPDATTEALGTHIRCAANRVASILEPALLADVIERKEHGATWLWCVGPNADMEQSTAPDEDAREVVKVSAMAAPSIFAYADQRGAAAFSTSLSTDGRRTIQRHGRVIAELTDAERREFVKTATEGVPA